MRIAIIGQEAFGGSVLDALVQAGENVVAVFLPPDREGRPPDPVKAAAQGHNIPVHQFRRMRNQAAVDAFKEVNADLCVMAFVTDIIPDAILEAPNKGTIQYHPSLLPKHRGPSSMNWPIIYGETETGLTIFWPDKGLDTGPVLLQKTVEITPDDTLGSLYFDKLFPMGVDALVEAVGMVAGGAAPRIFQDESQATYEGWCRAEDITIDWSKPAADIYNRIRGGDPSPGAVTTLDGQQVQFFRTEMRASAGSGEPGRVTEIADDGFAVAAGDGTLFVRRVQPAGSGKVMAPEWVQSVGLKPGSRFGG
ncbi:MAG: methionyl-tRNA formyltransferase [SAR202 cluster bacterium Io17-Chloro-G9]|nr:MAG: methionyl-tRNA formyltransferase [SAR202 cluster bacterium Io17-Chloro-G9]